MTPRAERKRIVVVLGMHRSGTSAVTRGLKSLGVDLGERLLPPVAGDNDKGYWEDVDVHQLNDELLAALGRDWASLGGIAQAELASDAVSALRVRAVDLLRDRTRTAPVFGLKNPRMAVLLQFWRPVFEHVGLVPSYVISVRNPLSVARSLSANNLRGDIPAEKSYYLWLEHVVRAAVDTAESPRVFVDFDVLLERPREQLERISRALKLPAPDPAGMDDYMREFLDAGLRHTRFQADDLQLAPGVPPEARDAFLMLERLATDKVAASSPESRELFARLDARLQELRPAFCLAADREQKLRETRQQVGVYEAHIASLNEAVAQRDARLHEQNMGLAERDGQIIRLSQAVNDRDAQIAALNLRLEDREEHLRELFKSEAVTAVRIAKLESDISDRDVKITLLNQAVVEQDGHSGALNRVQAERDREIIGLNQAVADRDVQVAALSRDIEQRERRIEQLQQAVGSRDGEVIRLEQALAERDRRGLAFDEALAERDRRIASLNQAVGERNAHVVWLKRQLREHDERIAQLQKVINENAAQIGGMHQAVASLNAQLADRDRRLEELGRAHAELNARAEAARLGFEALVSSRSWQLTRPLRALIDMGLRGASALRSARTPRRAAEPSRTDEPDRPQGSLPPPSTPPSPPPGRVAADGPAEAPPSNEPVAQAPASPFFPPVPAIEQARRAMLDDARERFIAAPDGSQIPPAARQPCISVIMPVYKVPVDLLRDAIDSVIAQTYPNWQLCVVDDCSNSAEIRAELARYQALDHRVEVKVLARNMGISGASNEALAMARGEFVALLDNDDMLTVDALATVASHIELYPEADVLYSDECKTDERGTPTEIFAKPDWSPMLMLNCMYIGHLTTYRRALVQDVGGFRSAYDFSQDYDLALRVTEKTGRIVHIERVLYGWRMIASSAAAGGKPQARVSNIAALQDAIERRGWRGVAVPLPTANRVVFDTSQYSYKVSLVVPSDNRRNILDTIESVTARSSYANYEMVVVTNSRIVDDLEKTELDARVRLVRYDKPYSFSDKCNVGAAASDGEFVVFFNDDVRPITPDWMQALLEYLLVEGVGIVGPKLLYENQSIQHAGMVTGVRTFVGTAFHCLPGDTTAHYNFAQSVREVSLICGACLAMRRELFTQLGGFDEVNLPINHSDVDLCFKVREKGLSCVYTPHAELLHIGHLSLREVDLERKAAPPRKDKGEILLLRKWARLLGRDPYYTRTMRALLYRDSPEEYELAAPSREFARGTGKDVLLVSHDLSESGAPRVVVDMARTFAAEGHFVVVMSPSNGPVRFELEQLGVPVIMDSRVLGGGESFAHVARNFDVVVCNTVVTWRAVATLGSDPDCFWYLHEVELLLHMVRSHPELAQVIRNTTSILAGSDRVRDTLKEYRSDVTVLEYGVEIPPRGLAAARRAAQASASASRVVCGIFGSYEPRKGQDLMVKAVREMPEELRANCEFRFYGRVLDPVFFSALRDIARETPSVTLHTEISLEEYFERMAECHLIVVPSRDDTLPLVSLHALAFGKPLVCTLSTGTSNYLSHMRSGILIAANTPSAIAQALFDAWSARERWPEIGEGGRAVFQQNFRPERFRRRLLDIVVAEDEPAGVRTAHAPLSA